MAPRLSISSSPATPAAESRQTKPPVTLAVCIRRAYDLLFAAYGHQHWWPGDSPFEVCVGAILTQNTNWANVERAIAALKAAGCLSPGAIHDLRQGDLARLIRPAGYFNVKARRLKEFVRVVQEDFGGQLERFFSGPTVAVRVRLLAIKGIGPETADSMLLYAGNHASFVVDAYTKRVFSRHGWCETKATYDEVKSLCESGLSDRTPDQLPDYWGDYHAQLVRVAKLHCRKAEPRCHGCPLQPLLPETRPAPVRPTEAVDHPRRSRPNRGRSGGSRLATLRWHRLTPVDRP